MEYNFFLLTKEEADDPSKKGFAYIKANQDRLISVSGDYLSFLATGYNIGEDFIIYEDKCYFVSKTFLDISNNKIILLGYESRQSCDIKNFS